MPSRPAILVVALRVVLLAADEPDRGREDEEHGPEQPGRGAAANEHRYHWEVRPEERRMTTPTAVRRMAASAAGALAVLAAVVLLAVPAAAHAMMTGTSPEEGATVTEQLDTVVLEFSEAVGFAQVQVTGPAGEPVEGGAPVEQGSIVELPLPPELEPGVYMVAFRVTSDDGHPIAETFAFAYEGSVEESEGDESAEVEGGSSVSEEARDLQQAPDSDRGGLVLVGALVALVVFAAAAVFAARREAAKETDAGGPDTGERDDARP